MEVIMNITIKDLQSKIKAKMYDKRITHQQLADQIGISKQGVSSLLSSNKVKFDKLFYLAEKVGLCIEINIYDKGGDLT